MSENGWKLIDGKGGQRVYEALTGKENSVS